MPLRYSFYDQLLRKQTKGKELRCDVLIPEDNTDENRGTGTAAVLEARHDDLTAVTASVASPSGTADKCPRCTRLSSKSCNRRTHDSAPGLPQASREPLRHTSDVKRVLGELGITLDRSFAGKWMTLYQPQALH